MSMSCPNNMSDHEWLYGLSAKDRDGVLVGMSDSYYRFSHAVLGRPLERDELQVSLRCYCVIQAVLDQ